MLYLHIGTGKAGSTTIQDFLADFQHELSHQQLKSFEIGNAWKISAAAETERSYWYWVEQRKILDDASYKELSSNFWQLVQKEVEDLGKCDFIASSEYIYMVYEKNDVAAIHAFKEKLEGIFGEIKVLVYLRNQIDFVKSVYAQRVKGPARETMSFCEYIKNLDKLKVPIDYAEQLKYWGEAFGWENIELAVFDRRNFLNSSLLEDFCHRTNIKFEEKFSERSQDKSNVSPSYSHINAQRFLNIIRLKYGRNYALKLIRHLIPPNGYPGEYDDKIRERVSTGNKWLNQTFFKNYEVKLPEIE
ncbi:MAG: hypothetical protein KJO81_11320 [Gammaproteobacteria bacterium]|nr:hypothetical protein [Gammaproteobacteria bacterium]